MVLQGVAGPDRQAGSEVRLGPSPHLSWAELACRDGTIYPPEWRVARAEPLAEEFETIREIVGGPIQINSAYRTVEHNRKSKSKPTSQHVEGRALDLGVPAWLTILSFSGIVIEVARRPGSHLRGIGLYPGFIHIDTRPTIRIARWRGSRLNADFSIA